MQTKQRLSTHREVDGQHGGQTPEADVEEELKTWQHEGAPDDTQIRIKAGFRVKR